MTEIICQCGMVHHREDTEVGYHFRCHGCDRVLELRQVELEDAPLPQAVGEPPVASEETSELAPAGQPGRSWRVVRVAMLMVALLVVVSMALSSTRIHWWPLLASAPYGRPQSGAQLVYPNQETGTGILMITNISTHDALVQLVVEGEIVRAIYVRSREAVRLQNVAPGEYLVQFGTGLGWNSDHHRFERYGAYGQFHDRLEYAVRETSLSRYELTLDGHPSLSAKAEVLRPEEFIRPSRQHLPGTIQL